MKTRFMQPKSLIRRSQTNSTRIRGGKMVPVLATYFGQSESGVLRQNVALALDAIPGEVQTPMYFEVHTVFCPMQAMVNAKDPTSETAGLAEVIRKRLIAEEDVFDVEAENPISKALDITPMPLAGQKVVSEQLRLAHNVIINFLRRRKYINTQTIDEFSNTSITPALLGTTILERLNAVLDPEDRVNGAVNLSGKIAVTGVGVNPNQIATSTGATVFTDEQRTGDAFNSADTVIKLAAETIEGKWVPQVFADLDQSGADISLTDFEAAQTQDEMSRWMRSILKANPEHGEEILARVAYGLQVDTSATPILLYKQRIEIGSEQIRAFDGPSIEDEITQTQGGLGFSFTVPVPLTEFGGVTMTFVTLKPDEAFVSQPHPDFTSVVTGHNFPADLLALDPVPVLAREVDENVALAEEDTIVMWVGNNQLKRNYSTYGFSRDLDLTEVARKSSIWQLEIPTSVSPESIVYDEDIDHYIFADHAPGANVATVTASYNLTKSTPIVFGPTPIEEMPIIEDQNLFGDL